MDVRNPATYAIEAVDLKTDEKAYITDAVRAELEECFDEVAETINAADACDRTFGELMASVEEYYGFQIYDENTVTLVGNLVVIGLIERY